MSEQATTASTGGQISLQKLYVKDMSFESPNTPEVFTEELQPKTQLNLRSGHRELDEESFEVVLTVTVEAKADDKTVFLVEVQQAGLFRLAGVDEEQRAMLLGSFCPGVLYPYVREAISSTVQRGGYPEFLLQPIDFDGLYAQSRKEADGVAAEKQN
ncbi:MAG: protein-export chaperone SecB [Gammaproteobacteria bacterium]|jgi:preprotein translocase subunit SecB